MRLSPVCALAICGVLFFGASAFAQSSSAAATQPATSPTDAEATVPTKSTVPANASKNLINLNTATIEQLETLPGIGRKTAERIIEVRTKSGGFKRIEELMNVKGIGEKSFLKLKPLIVVPAKADKAPGA